MRKRERVNRELTKFGIDQVHRTIAKSCTELRWVWVPNLECRSMQRQCDRSATRKSDENQGKELTTTTLSG